MIKWFAYIVLLLIFAPCLTSSGSIVKVLYVVDKPYIVSFTFNIILPDTLLNKYKKQQELEEKNKIKEVSKVKRQAKPETVDENGNITPKKIKPKRQRRPEGLERPPEIPRRNGN